MAALGVVGALVGFADAEDVVEEGSHRSVLENGFFMFEDALDDSGASAGVEDEEAEGLGGVDGWDLAFS